MIWGEGTGVRAAVSVLCVTLSVPGAGRTWRGLWASSLPNSGISVSGILGDRLLESGVSLILVQNLGGGSGCY